MSGFAVKKKLEYIRHLIEIGLDDIEITYEYEVAKEFIEALLELEELINNEEWSNR